MHVLNACVLADLCMWVCLGKLHKSAALSLVSEMMYNTTSLTANDYGGNVAKAKRIQTD